MRVAIVYDCLYPYTIGGAERWYRGVAERLARRHHVTYITRRQWSRRAEPRAPAGVELVAVSGGRSLYTAAGRRRITTPVRFGCGLLLHLLRHRRRYDIVHTCGFPYFSLIAARMAAAMGGPPVVTDWLEIWPARYWQVYLGGLEGRAAVMVQRLCIGLTRHAFVFSELYAARLREAGYRGQPTILRGMYDGPAQPLPSPSRRAPLVIFLGRHIAEKHPAAIPAAIDLARREIPDLRAIIFGDGPERGRVLAEIGRLKLEGIVSCPGFAPWEAVDAALREAMCLLLPSAREGYGLAVVEASACGTPALVVAGPDNAATELIAEGQNGFIALDADPATLAAAIVRVRRTGPALAESTRAWFARNADGLVIDSSVARIESVYAQVAGKSAR